jgi:hypothetical protein
MVRQRLSAEKAHLDDGSITIGVRAANAERIAVAHVPRIRLVDLLYRLPESYGDDVRQFGAIRDQKHWLWPARQGRINPGAGDHSFTNHTKVDRTHVLRGQVPNRSHRISASSIKGRDMVPYSGKRLVWVIPGYADDSSPVLRRDDAVC